MANVAGRCAGGRAAVWVLGATVALAFTLGTPMEAMADKSLKKAQRHYRKAQKFYRLGKFELALVEFSRAYEAKPRAGILFNIGQVHKKLKNYKQAIHFYNGFVRERPKDKKTFLARRLLKEMEEKNAFEMEKQRLVEDRERLQEELEQARRDAVLQPPPESPPAPAQDATNESAGPEVIVAAPSSVVAAASVPTAMTPPAATVVAESTPLYKEWWVWTVAGVVAAGAGTAAILMTGADGTSEPLPATTLGTLDRR